MMSAGYNLCSTRTPSIPRYYMDRHLFLAHRIGMMPSDSLKPREEEVVQVSQQEDDNNIALFEDHL